MDIFVVAPDRSEGDLPDTLVAGALRARKPVILPTALKAHYGVGPTYFEEPDFGQTLAGAISTAKSGGPGRADGGRADFVTRCEAGPLTRLRGRRIRRSGRGSRTDDRPVLFIPANGVNMVNMKRLLTIARRMDRRAVFASQAPALQVIRDFGFAAEYIPSHAAVGGDFEAWDSWFSSEVDRVANAYDAGLVVYDGNHMSPGLKHAVASRRDCRLAWIRRAMWARTTSRFPANTRWCDLVIEPGELAGERTSGRPAYAATRSRWSTR